MAEEHEEGHKGYQPIDEIRSHGGLDKLVGPSVGARPASLARMHLDPALDKQLSAAVGVALGTWYNLEAMAVFCLKDTVALPGFTRYFRERASEEYREARSILDYVSQRGGAVQFKEIAPPPNSFNHEEKGDALFLMEYALALEKVQSDKYGQLFRAAVGSGDPGVQAFVQERLLGPRAAIIQRTAQYVAQLRRLGKGAGVFIFNEQLLVDQPKVESLGNGVEASGTVLIDMLSKRMKGESRMEQGYKANPLQKSECKRSLHMAHVCNMLLSSVSEIKRWQPDKEKHYMLLVQ